MPSRAAPVIGVVNAGSSSLKFSVYEAEALLLAGQLDGIGVRPRLRVAGADGHAFDAPDIGTPATPADALPRLLPWLREWLAGRALDAIGHRVVHGGATHARPERVTPSLLRELAELGSLAPLHQPHNLAPIHAILEHAPDLPQVACFDTAFHRTVPEVAQAFAIPQELAAQGIRRYGFHGLSYEYIASALPSVAPGIAGGRVVVAHLGNGASLCALQERRSVATTMGFSALDGLPMGTRCGELDPGVVLHLLDREAMSAREIEELLYRRSGLFGLSGISADMRDLLASADPRARFALEVFVYRIARGIGSLAAALGGLDGIVFTAGIGENAAPVRAAICRACSWLGVEPDEEANAAHGPRISAARSRVAAFVIPTDENRMIARHTRAAIGR
jgi:acetate kinase